MSRVKGRGPQAPRREPDRSITLRLPLRRIAGLFGLLLGLSAAGAAGWWWYQRPPSPPRVSLDGAQAAVRINVDAAVAAVERDARSPVAWGELGMVYQAHDFDAEAATCYQQAARAAPKAPRWPYLEALALATSDPQAALEALRRAQRIGAEGLAVDWHEGNLLFALDRPAEAAEAFDRGLAHDPTSAPLLSGKGRLALQSGKTEEAITVLERAIAADPSWAESYVLLAQAYGRAGRDEDSRKLALLARAIQKQDQVGPPDRVFQAVVERGVSVRWLIRRGQAAAQGGRLEDADALFRQAIAADPTVAAAYLGLGVTMQNSGDLAGAIGQYRLALEQDPENVEAMADLGQALSRDGHADEAVSVLQEALRLAPGHPGVSLNLGAAHLERGEGEPALEVADQALALLPRDTRLLEMRARALGLLDRPLEAEAAWKALSDVAPGDQNALSQQAAAAMAAGRHAEAIALLRRGLLTFPDSALLKGTLAWELATAPEDALRSATEALELARSVAAGMAGAAQGQDLLAAALAENGDWAGAEAAAEAALAGLPAGDTRADQMRARLALYRQRRPYRQPR
jgi:tetratricopeptide (TPR) repeat protein